MGYSNNFTSLPIIRTDLTEYAVCFDKTMNSKSPNWTLYPLIYTDNYGDCPIVDGIYTDPRFTQIDSISEEYLFDTNGVANLIATLPEIN